MSASATLDAPPAADVTVRVLDAHKIYGAGAAAVRALDGVSVEVPRGQFLAIMGPSGSGKSTLLHCMAGLDRLTQGTVELSGRALGDLNDRDLTHVRRASVGFIFQAYNLVPTLTARENITLPADLGGQDVDPAWFDQIVETLGIAERLSHKPKELSGGQQQRVAAARALVTRPAVVFADEPTGALDSNSGAELLAFLARAAQDFQQTIVMVTHDPSAASHAERLLFLADGQIVDEMANPSADAILDRMKELDTDAAAG